MTVTPEAGDFACTQIHGEVGFWIRVGQGLNGDGFANFEHAFVYVGNGQIIEAEPGGARLADLSEYDGNTFVWSTGVIALTDVDRTEIVDAAMSYRGVPYSFLDYVSLALARLHIRLPGVKRYVQSTKHMICSQLVDQCYQDAGVQLYDDGRWAGDVTPADLAALVSEGTKSLWNLARM